MIIIRDKQGQVDTSVIVGIVVVLAIVSAAGFSIYYFGFVRPRRNELKNTRAEALSSLNSTLANVDTSQASVATQTYRTQLQASDSKEKIISIMETVANIYTREKKREELLNFAKTATHGSFYTLNSLYDNLKESINSKETLQQLNSFESQIREKATSEWTNVHTNNISSISTDTIVLRKKNTPIFWKDGLTQSEAMSQVQGRTLQELREMKFEESGSYAVPILDVFRRAPSVKEGSVVDIGLYDRESENLLVIGEDCEVLDIIYPQDVMSSVSWSKSEGGTSASFSTNIWEEIKASEAGSAAATATYQNWASKVIEKARKNSLGDYELETLYVVEIPAQGDAKYVTKFEQYKEKTHDIVLIPQAD